MNGAGNPIRGARGQPLLVLAALLGGWVALRAVLWQSPFPPLVNAPVFAGAPGAEAGMAVVAPSRALPRSPLRSSPDHRFAVPGALDAPNAASLPPPWQAAAGADEQPAALPLPTLGAPATERRIVGQQLLLAAAFSHMALPPEIAAYFAPPKPPSTPAPAFAVATPRATRPAPFAAPNRWSGDAWLLARRDSTGALAAGEPSYGRSQAGAVLRYRLAPASGYRPFAYARATRAMAGPRETEVAVGLSARPIAGVPVSVAGEVRAYHGPMGREMRPAAFAVTELPPAKLPLGVRGEAYAQAGYVGGRFATAFVDGQARVDAKLAGVGRAGELRAGAGVWGGAQKHTARLDVGPSATLNFRLGRTQSRVAVDYRWRVAGDAEPESGPALTISAGF